MAGGGDTSGASGGTSSGGMSGGMGPATAPNIGSMGYGQTPLYQTAQTPFSGYRPTIMGPQFYQPIYRPEYQNFANPMTAFNVSSYGTSPVPSAAFGRAMTPGGIGLPGLYQNIQNYASNFMNTPGASFGRLLSDMRSQGVSPMDMQMAYGGFGMPRRFGGMGNYVGYGSMYGGPSGGWMGGVPSMTTPFSRPFTPEMYMFSQYPQTSFGGSDYANISQRSPTVSSTPLIYGPMAKDPTQRAIPTQAQFAAQQSIIRDPQAAALAAAKQGMNAGMTNQQIADTVNQQYGKSFSAQNVADFIAANNAALTAPTSPDPTQRAIASPTQLAAQQSIVANPQQAAMGAVTSGFKSGLSPQAIADQVNQQYGKSFSAQNVIDFAKANNIAMASGGIASLMRRK